MRFHAWAAPILVLATSAAALTAAGPFSAAYLEIGYDPILGKVAPERAARAHGEIARFMEAYGADAKVDPALASQARDVAIRLASLDAANLYDTLPDKDAASLWRSFALVGRARGGRYELGSVDSKDAAWERLSLSTFGDLGLRVRARPAQAETFELSAEGRFHLGSLPPANVARVGEALLAAAPRGSLAREWPHFYTTLTRYFHVDANLAPGGRLDLSLTPDPDALEDRYPDLAAVIEHLTGAVAMTTDLRARDGTSCRIEVLPDPLTLRFTGVPVSLPLAAEGRHELRAETNVHLDIQGLSFAIATLPSVISYELGRGGPQLELALRDPPRQVEVAGFALHFIPLWLVDLFVPENLDGLATHFLKTLASGRGGRGLTLTAGLSPDAPPGTPVGVRLDTEVLANDFLKFALDLEGRLGLTSGELYSDVARLQQELWEALKTDLEAGRGPA